MNTSEYTDLINSVKDKYGDFLRAFDSSRISEEYQAELAEFIKNNPDADTSQVIFKYGQLKGVFPKDMKYEELLPDEG